MFWIVRADTFWYRFDSEIKAKNHYQYILDNINGKYKKIEKVYLAQYEECKVPKVLEMWNRPQLENEEEQGYGK